MNRFKKGIFNRGSMRFDDVNYDLYNQFILIDPYYDSDDEENNQSLNGFVPAKVSIENKSRLSDGEDGASIALTIKNITNQPIEEYDHNIMDTRTNQ